MAAFRLERVCAAEEEVQEAAVSSVSSQLLADLPSLCPLPSFLHITDGVMCSASATSSSH